MYGAGHGRRKRGQEAQVDHGSMESTREKDKDAKRAPKTHRGTARTQTDETQKSDGGRGRDEAPNQNVPQDQYSSAK